MTAVRAALPVAALALALGAAPATADAPVVRVVLPWVETQEESVCGGEVVQVAYDGVMTMQDVRGGSWIRVRTDFRWEQGGVAYVGHATASFTSPPAGRATTYRFQGSAVGDEGQRVQVHEVVHALWSDGEPEVRVEFERVVCR